MAFNADGFEIAEPAAKGGGVGALQPVTTEPQRNEDGFELAPSVERNADGFEIVPTLRSILDRPVPDDLQRLLDEPALGPVGALAKQGGFASPLRSEPFQEPGYTGENLLPDKLHRAAEVLGKAFEEPPTTTGREGSDEEFVAPLSPGVVARELPTAAGRYSQAVVGDVAAELGERSGLVKGAREVGGGNVGAFKRGEKLPIQKALELSKETDLEEGVLGWQSIAADISLGLADLAPKIALLEATPGAGLAAPKTAAGAVLFGYDEEGKFSAKNAAFGAAFPFATKAVSEATDRAIQKAVERGFEWAGTPGAQRALHIAANQAAMDTLMATQSTPELADLAESNPDEFKRQVAKILGSNLAFAIPEALKEYSPKSKVQSPKSGETPPPPGSEPEAPKPVKPTEDLAAELQRAMTQNQVAAKPAGEEPPLLKKFREQTQETKRIEEELQQKAAGEVEPQKPTSAEASAGGGAEGAEAPADKSAVAQDILDKAMAVEAKDHPEIAASNPEILPQIVADELKADPKAYAGELSAEDQAALQRELEAELGTQQEATEPTEKRQEEPVKPVQLEENIKNTEPKTLYDLKKATRELTGDRAFGTLSKAEQDSAITTLSGWLKSFPAVERQFQPELDRIKDTLAQWATIRRNKRSGNFLLKERPDGEADILDAIQALGGMAPPDEKIWGNWRDKVRGVARLLIRKGGRSVDLLVDDLNGKKRGTGGRNRQGPEGEFPIYRLETPDDLFDAIDQAVSEREGLARTGGGPEAQMERFWEAATKPNDKSGLRKINVQQLVVGDRFRLRYPGATHEELEVRHIDPDNGEVQVKDGPTFGTRELPDGAEIWVVAKGAQIGGPPETGVLKEEPGEPRLWNLPDDQILDGLDNTSGAERENYEIEARARGLIDRTDAEEEARQREERERTGAQAATAEREAQREEILRRQQPDRTARRQRAPQREQSLPEPEPAQRSAGPEAGEVRRAPAPTPALPRLASDREAAARQLGDLADYTEHEMDVAWPKGTIYTPSRALQERSRQDQIAYLGQYHETVTEAREAILANDQARLQRIFDQAEFEAGYHEKHVAKGLPHAYLSYQGDMSLRRLDGILDGLESIKAAIAGGNRATAKQQLLAGFEDWLNRAIDATRPEAGLYEGVTGAPVWMTKAALNGMLKVVRAALRAGRVLSDAITQGIEWVRHHYPLEGFNDQELRDFLEDKYTGTHTGPRGTIAEDGSSQPRRSWKLIQAELDQAAAELLERTPRRGQKTTPEERQAAALARARYNGLKSELVNHPGYVGNLLTRHERLFNTAKTSPPGPDREWALGQLEEVRAQLEEAPPALVNRAYLVLQAEGALPASPAPRLPGRSLGDVTAWLRQEGVDSPKLNLVQRLQLGEKVMRRLDALRDGTEQARLKLGGAWKTMVDLFKKPPTDTEFRRVVKDWLFADQFTGVETHDWMREIRKAVGNPLREMAITVWLDANGDQALLQHQAQMVPERWRPVYEAALDLRPGEKALALRIKSDFASKLTDALDAGLMEQGRQNYGTPQLWQRAPDRDVQVEKEIRKGSPGNPFATLDPRNPFFSFQRSHNSYFDGIMDGGIPKSLRIGDLVGYYNVAFQKALSSRGMIGALKDATTPKGDPLVRISGTAQKVSDNGGAIFVDAGRKNDAVTLDGRPYKAVDHWALKDWKIGATTESGEKVILKGDMLVHPDYFDWLKNELGRSRLSDPAELGKIFGPMMRSGSFLKASKFASATFHGFTIGEHALFHWVNPLSKFTIDLREPKQAALVRGGMELGMGHERELFEEGLASHGGIWGHVPGLGDAMGKMSDFLFQEYIPGMKMKAGLAVLERNLKRYSSELSEEQVYERTADEMNAAFGKQNWRLLGSNKTWLDINRLFFSAPDFLLSRMKVVGQAFQPYHREQRYFLLAQGLIVYGLCRAANLILDGDPHWEPENALSVVHNGRAYSARFIVNDLFNAAKDVTQIRSRGTVVPFLTGRLGPWTRSIIEGIFGRDLRTGGRKDLLFKTDSGVLRAAEIVAQDLADWLIPIGFEWLKPNQAAREQTTAGTIALGLVGVGSRKYSPATKVFDWAREFNRHSEDPAARTWQRQRDESTYEESIYRKLDNLLAAGDFKRARSEYEELIKDGHTPENIAARYRRATYFTGSRAREEDFRESLTSDQAKVYDTAQAERAARGEQFQAMIDAAGR